MLPQGGCGPHCPPPRPSPLQIPVRKFLPRDFGVTFFTQAGSAVLSLLLVKLSVRHFETATYGVVALLLGIQVFARNTLCNPLLNLAVYHHPAISRDKGSGWLYHTTFRALKPLVAFSAILFACLIWALAIPIAHLFLATMMLTALLGTEAVKTARLNLLHVEGHAQSYAWWVFADASVKPLVLFLFLGMTTTRSPLLLLGAHVLGSTIILAATAFAPRIRHLGQPTAEAPPPLRPLPWVAQNRAFLWPLLCLGLVGWVTGLSDRFLVNLALGPGSAGIYAGIYGIFSLPFILTGNAMTLATRPELLKRSQEATNTAWFRVHWVQFRALALLLAGLGFALYFLREPIVRIALAPPYLQALPAVPGILLGNAILALGTYLELAFYLHQRTELALVKQAVGAVSALGFVLLLLPLGGIAAVGWACALYAILEFGSGAWLLHQIRHKSIN